MYQLFLVPILAGIIAQIIKLATDKISGNFTWRHFVSDYGRMPSSHTAFVAALTAGIILKEGIAAPSFAIALIFSILAIRDAVGLRWHISQQNKLLNKISRQLNLAEKTLEEKIYHTPSEIAAGLLLGAGLALIFHFFFSTA